MYIYGLQLLDLKNPKQKKYYVGRSDNPEERIQQHRNEKGSSWTSTYPFEKVLFIKESTSCFDKEKYTKELMMQYGIDHVRGASYTTLVLDRITKDQLQKEIWGAKDVCIRCGFEGHFMKDCKKKVNVNGEKIPVKKIIKKQPLCEKCHRKGHLTSKCLATTKADGTPLLQPCQKCGKFGHKKTDCVNNI